MNFNDFSIAINILIFSVCAGFVWIAGTKLTSYMDGISKKTGLGHAFVGVLFLGGITSLPELATVTTAAFTGNAPLAINNMLGSISINLVILALADIVIGKDALTSVVAHSSTLLQGTLNIFLLTIVALAGLVGGVTFFGASLWSWALLPTFVILMWLSGKYRDRQPWIIPDERGRGEGKSESGSSAESRGSGEGQLSTTRLVGFTIVASLTILVAGYFLAQTADALANQTGIGSSMIGLVLLAFATGLPEISSVYAAMKKGHYEMAIGDIFGTNMWNVAIIGLADFFFREGSALGEVGTFELVATLLAIVLTCIFVIGLLERKDKTIARMGYDSFGVLLIYIAGVVLLYFVDAGRAGG